MELIPKILAHPINQSLPRAVPGTGIMGFDMIKDTNQGENFYRAALSLNNSLPGAAVNPNEDPIPFLRYRSRYGTR